jgi:hypothetical protein
MPKLNEQSVALQTLEQEGVCEYQGRKVEYADSVGQFRIEAFSKEHGVCVALLPSSYTRLIHS